MIKGKIERIILWIVILLMVAGNAHNAHNIRELEKVMSDVSVRFHEIDVKLDRLIKEK